MTWLLGPDSPNPNSLIPYAGFPDLLLNMDTRRI